MKGSSRDGAFPWVSALLEAFGIRVQDFWFSEVQGARFVVRGAGFVVQDAGFKVRNVAPETEPSPGCQRWWRIWGSRCRVQGLWFSESGCRFQGSGDEGFGAQILVFMRLEVWSLRIHVIRSLGL